MSMEPRAERFLTEWMRRLIDLVAVVAIGVLLVSFMLQFDHPASFDTQTQLAGVRALGDRTLGAIASIIGLSWPPAGSLPSRGLPLLVCVAVFGLRMAGFACSVMAVKSPIAALVQYAMLFVAIGGGMWMIIAGIVVEPPPAMLEAITRSNARIARLFGRPVTA